MGLIAREIEARGIPTISMSSARSITHGANPPRAVYLDYPLGRTAGKPNDPVNQMAIMRATLDALTAIEAPGTIIDLPFTWQNNDEWKDRVMRPKQNSNAANSSHDDDRVARFDTPQYQLPSDAQSVNANCPTCIFLEDEK